MPTYSEFKLANTRCHEADYQKSVAVNMSTFVTVLNWNIFYTHTEVCFVNIRHYSCSAQRLPPVLTKLLREHVQNSV